MSKPTDLEYVMQEVLDYLNGVSTASPMTLSVMVRDQLADLREARRAVERMMEAVNADRD